MPFHENFEIFNMICSLAKIKNQKFLVYQSRKTHRQLQKKKQKKN